MKKSIILIPVIGILMMSGCVFPPPPPSSITQVYIYPINTYVEYDNIFTIEVRCDVKQPIKGWELEIQYDNNSTTTLSANWGDIWELYTTEVFYSSNINVSNPGRVNNIYALIVTKGTQSISSGSLITILCKPIMRGQSPIEIVNAHFYNETSEIPIEITNGKVIVY